MVMSTWIEIKDSNDVSVDRAWGDIRILYGTDDLGNNYISVPIELIAGALIEAGYEINIPTEDD